MVTVRLLSLDFEPVYGDDAEIEHFSSDASIFDYDVVIWDPAASFESYARPGYQDSYQGLPSLSDDMSVRIMSDTLRRRTEFSEFVNAGRVLIVVVRSPQACYVATGEKTYSGTGRNRQTTRIVNNFDLHSALPIPKCKFITGSGKRIELSTGGPLVEFLRKYRARVTYDATLEGAPGSVLARVSGTQRVVSSALRTKAGGWIILLPAIDLAADDEDTDESADDEGWWSEAPQFQADLLSAVRQLGANTSVSRPAWIESYATAEQQRLRTEIIKQQKRVESARDKLAQLQRNKEKAESKDQLFLGTGRALELEVKEVLELLGGTVTDPEPGRDDWRVKFPEGAAVVEVKGVSKSAAEKHAAQLEKWVAGAYEEGGSPPKGILIVNTWRETPLVDRKEIDFPEQMLPYSTSRNHCLITGLQLFVIRADVENDPNRAKHWRNKILQTAGKIDDCDDWQTLIQVTKTAE